MKLYTSLIQDLIDNNVTPNVKFSNVKDWSYRALLKEACLNRGIEFEQISEHNFYFKKDGVYIGSVSNMLSNMISSTSVTIAKNKYLTHKILKAAKIPVPLQRKFQSNELYNAKSFILEQKGKLVIKPLDAMGGQGITVNLDSNSNIEEAWQKAIDACITKPKIVLVEEMIHGIDIRAVVINGKFKCACSRVPAHVVGDGNSSINQLIREKNEVRKLMPFHKLYPIQDVDYDYVPNFNEIYWINNITTINAGGEALEITNKLSNDLKFLAERAVKAVPGLNMAGVDFMADSLTDVNKVKVLEVNTFCNLNFNHFPYYGNNFDLFGSLVDETLNCFYGF